MKDKIPGFSGIAFCCDVCNGYSDTNIIVGRSNVLNLNFDLRQADKSWLINVRYSLDPV